MVAVEAVPLAKAWASVCRVLVAKSKIAVVLAVSALTWITGRTAARALMVLALFVSSKVSDFIFITLFSTLVIKASVSILTLVAVTAYSVSTSSAIALK